MKKARCLFVLIIIPLSTLISSCALEKPLAVNPSDNNKSYKIEYLFEHDGCKMYRFLDRGHYVYFSNCTGDVTAIKNDSTAHRTQVITKHE